MNYTYYSNMKYKEEYDEMIDECNEPVKIGMLTYSPSWVLEQVDPTAYRIGYSEYIDFMQEEE